MKIDQVSIIKSGKNPEKIKKEDAIKEGLNFSERFVTIIKKGEKTKLSEEEVEELQQELVGIGKERIEKATNFLKEVREVAVYLAGKALSEVGEFSLEERATSSSRYDLRMKHGVGQAASLSKMVGILDQALIGERCQNAVAMNQCLNNLLGVEGESVEWTKHIIAVGDINRISIKSAIGTIMFFLAIEEKNYYIIRPNVASAAFPRPWTEDKSRIEVGQATRYLKDHQNKS